MGLRSRVAAALLVLGLSMGWARAGASETAAEHAASVYAAQQMTAHPRNGNLPDYALPPAKLVQAQQLASMRLRLHFGGELWGIASLALLLWLGGIRWMRNRALDAGAPLVRRRRRVGAFAVEALAFSGLFVLATTLLDLPIALYRHHLSLLYGLSIQSWASWMGDLGKSLLIDWAGMFVIFALAMSVLRRFPRRWWVVFWIALAPLMVFVVYIAPVVVDPLFNHFEPLAATQPALVERLEQVVAKGHMDIPPERMYLMRASEKVTTINAYVTGFGGSKRVVVWDTSLRKATPDEVLFIFGHESGHYVLGHVTEGMVEIFLALFLLLWLAHLALRWMIARFGLVWHIPSTSDWGAVAVLLLLLTVFSSALEPALNSMSRMKEHAADVYGQEAIHGLVADPQETARAAFAVLGENSLDVPNVAPWVEFWTDSHPSTGRRAGFAHAYDPWAPGTTPKYLPR